MHCAYAVLSSKPAAGGRAACAASASTSPRQLRSAAPAAPRGPAARALPACPAAAGTLRSAAARPRPPALTQHLVQPLVAQLFEEPLDVRACQVCVQGWGAGQHVSAGSSAAAGGASRAAAPGRRLGRQRPPRSGAGRGSVAAALPRRGAPGRPCIALKQRLVSSTITAPPTCGQAGQRLRRAAAAQGLCCRAGRRLALAKPCLRGPPAWRRCGTSPARSPRARPAQ
jgi:hypothetical protein